MILDLRAVEKAMEDMAFCQHELNCLANGANWISLNREWWRAVWIECAEFCQHYGTWEWWKKSNDPDPFQCKLELVDIWHFGLSSLIEAHSSIEIAAKDIMSRFPSPSYDYYSRHTPVQWIERVALVALKDYSFDIGSFFNAVYRLPCSFDEFYKLYTAKGVLNSFRQNYGYKEGTYFKRWKGREDNYVLACVVADAPESLRVGPEFREFVYDQLKARYHAAGYGGLAGRVVP